jgi:hypothetical protein
MVARSSCVPTRRSWWSVVTGWLKESAALVGAVATLVAAAAGLIAILAGDDDDTTGGAPLPVVARLTGPDGVSERAFFSRDGSLVSIQYANQDDLSVVWQGADGELRARVKVDPRSVVSTGFTLPHLVGETGPERRFATSNGASMEPGEPVKAYISDDSITDGEVLAVGDRIEVGGVGVIDNLIVVDEVGRESEGGTPLLDEQNRVRGMLFAEDEGIGRTWVIPIEDIVARFPEAFD